MSHNVVPGTPGDRLDQDVEPRRTTSSGQPSDDPPPPFAETRWRSAGGLHVQPVARRKRPADLQYWACWIVAVAYPLFLVYLWSTR